MKKGRFTRISESAASRQEIIMSQTGLSVVIEKECGSNEVWDRNRDECVPCHAGISISALELIDKHRRYVPAGKYTAMDDEIFEIFYDSNGEEFRVFQNGCQVWHGGEILFPSDIEQADEMWEKMTDRVEKVKDWHDMQTRRKR